jgi:hypothetical protein
VLQRRKLIPELNRIDGHASVWIVNPVLVWQECSRSKSIVDKVDAIEKNFVVGSYAVTTLHCQANCVTEIKKKNIF